MHRFSRLIAMISAAALIVTSVTVPVMGEERSEIVSVSESVSAKQADEVSALEGNEIEYDGGKVCETEEEVRDEFLRLIAARDFTTYLYTNTTIPAFEGGTMYMDETFDLYAEREGMKPCEGDYMGNCIGNRDSAQFLIEDLIDEVKTCEVPGKTGIYNAYRPANIYITNAEEEKAVDEKIAKLLGEGGSLHSAMVSSDEETKIDACYNYVRNNVKSATGDRTMPLKHTAYYALIKGSGTCEAYAVLFGRLLREMGIPNKVILGTDANNHTYNIVQLHENGQEVWYFYDASGGKKKQDWNSFKRADLQDKFWDSRFVKNYLSKIKGYGTNPDAAYSVLKNGEHLDDCENMKQVYNRLLAEADETDSATSSYTIVMNKDDETNYGSSFQFGQVESDYFSVEHPLYKNITFDMNGHTLTSAKYSAGEILYLSMPMIKNGTIKIPSGLVAYIGGQNVNLSNVKIVGSGKTDALYLGQSVPNRGDFDDEFFEGKITFDEKCAISNVGQIISYNGFTMKGSVTAGKAYIGYTLWELQEGKTDIGYRTVNALFNDITVDELYGNNEASIYVSGTMTIKKHLEDCKPCQMAIYLNRTGKKQKDASLPNGKLILSGDILVKNAKREYIELNAFYEDEAWNLDGISKASFYGNDNIVTLNNVKARRAQRDSESLTLVTEENIKNYLMIGINGESKYYMDGNDFCIGVSCLHLYKNEQYIGDYVLYRDMMEDINAMMDTDKKNTTFTVKISEDVTVNGSLKLPSNSSSIIFETDLEKTEDNKATLTFAGPLKLNQNVTFKNIILSTVVADKKTKQYVKQPIAINLGNYELTLKGVAVNEGGDSSVASVSGGKKGFLHMIDSTATASGTVKLNQLALYNSTLVCQKNAKVGKLIFEGITYTQNNALKFAAKSEIGDIDFDNVVGERNLIEYRRDPKKKGPLLSIKGKVLSKGNIQLSYVLDGTPKESIPYVKSDVATTTGETVKILPEKTFLYAPKVPTGTIVCYGDGYSFGASYIPVKVKGNIILVKKEAEMSLMRASLVSIYNSNTKLITTCLDLNQACEEIKKAGYNEKSYILQMGNYGNTADGYGVDLNLLDKKRYSAFTLPKTGCSTIKLEGVNSENPSSPVKIPFTGNIAATGNLELKNVELISLKGKGSTPAPANFAIALKAAKGEGVPYLTLDSVKLAEGTAFSKLSGAKKGTELSKLNLIDCGDLQAVKAPVNFDMGQVVNSRLVYPQ